MRRQAITFGSIALYLLALMLFAGSAFAADPAGEPGLSSGAKNPLNNVYFGEQHLHTSASPDAFAFGTRNDAYGYAKGKAIKNTQSGKMIQKRTPYDWAAVTDHSEYLGMMPLLLDPSLVKKLDFYPGLQERLPYTGFHIGSLKPNKWIGINESIWPSP